jgi:hypothetical protein
MSLSEENRETYWVQNLFLCLRFSELFYHIVPVQEEQGKFGCFGEKKKSIVYVLLRGLESSGLGYSP